MEQSIDISKGIGPVMALPDIDQFLIEPLEAPEYNGYLANVWNAIVQGNLGGDEAVRFIRGIFNLQGKKNLQKKLMKYYFSDI